jgi:DNA-binding NarL/FixJ family response regulator
MLSLRKRIGSEMAMTTKPRVVIADEHRLVATGLERLLADTCTVVSTVYDGQALLKEVRGNRLDLAVLDISLPPQNGIDLIRDVLEINPAIRVIVVTMNDDAALAAEAFRAGASSYVLKTCASRELLEAVECTMAHQSYVTPLIASKLVQTLTNERSPQRGQLTTRQRAVLRLLAEGKSMKEVAALLKVTARTVAFHKYQMMRQLDIKTSAELVRFAVGRIA